MSQLLEQAKAIQSKIPPNVRYPMTLCRDNFNNFAWLNNLGSYDLTRLNDSQLQSLITQIKKDFEENEEQKKAGSATQKRETILKNRTKRGNSQKGKPSSKPERKGETAPGKTKKSKTHTKDFKQKEETKSDSIGDNMGSGSYRSVNYSAKNHHSLVDSIMNQHSTVERVSKIHYKGLFPYYISNPSKIFPRKLKTSSVEPILLLRRDLTHYLDQFMVSVLNSWKEMATAKKWKMYTYSSLGGEFIYNKKWANYTELLKLPSTKIIMPGCLCVGGRFNGPAWKEIAEHHELIIMTFYKKDAHCGCNTFNRMRRNSNKVRIIHSMSEENPYGIEN